MLTFTIESLKDSEYYSPYSNNLKTNKVEKFLEKHNLPKHVKRYSPRSTKKINQLKKFPCKHQTKVVFKQVLQNFREQTISISQLIPQGLKTDTTTRKENYKPI